MNQLLDKVAQGLLLTAFLFGILMIFTSWDVYAFLFVFLSLYMIVQGALQYNENPRSIWNYVFLGGGGLMLGLGLSSILV
ncbi:hypothetical protein H0266_02635 [Halobacillus locisalis]|uniref:Uncharacterized protein n=1 Tax=Halobacillus locisalis TaxID=220753 RepID=A0A838CP08_9BACI|nr:hypothetical protein [Halobacillus locisalis]MBA2173787.1 hypothetical protein [Halobacillus locisalis]